MAILPARMSNLQRIQHPIILFDGLCNLCSRSVQFVIKNDPNHHFRFASLQSNFGKQIVEHFGLSERQLNSFILLEEGEIYTKSTGALKVTKKLAGAWSWLSILILVPPIIRNGAYHFIAKNRYSWFGKKEICWIPKPELKALFLDDFLV